jgi:hypothetical protein
MVCSLQQKQAAVLLDEVVTGLGEKIDLSHLRSAATKERNDTAKAGSHCITGSKETHFVFIGLAYTVPPADSWIALTRHTPEVVVGTLNGIGVYAGMGVLAVVAAAPSPTST